MFCRPVQWYRYVYSFFPSLTSTLNYPIPSQAPGHSTVQFVHQSLISGERRMRSSDRCHWQSAGRRGYMSCVNALPILVTSASTHPLMLVLRTGHGGRRACNNCKLMLVNNSPNAWFRRRMKSFCSPLCVIQFPSPLRESSIFGSFLLNFYCLPPAL
jgi:hypothetical protein